MNIALVETLIRGLGGSLRSPWFYLVTSALFFGLTDR